MSLPNNISSICIALCICSLIGDHLRPSAASTLQHSEYAPHFSLSAADGDFGAISDNGVPIALIQTKCKSDRSKVGSLVDVILRPGGGIVFGRSLPITLRWQLTELFNWQMTRITTVRTGQELEIELVFESLDFKSVAYDKLLAPAFRNSRFLSPPLQWIDALECRANLVVSFRPDSHSYCYHVRSELHIKPGKQFVPGAFLGDIAQFLVALPEGTPRSDKNSVGWMVYSDENGILRKHPYNNINNPLLNSDIRLGGDGALLYVLGQDNPNIRLIGTTRYNTSISMCPFSWDAHFVVDDKMLRAKEWDSGTSVVAEYEITDVSEEIARSRLAMARIRQVFLETDKYIFFPLGTGVINFNSFNVVDQPSSVQSLYASGNVRWVPDGGVDGTGGIVLTGHGEGDSEINAAFSDVYPPTITPKGAWQLSAKIRSESFKGSVEFRIQGLRVRGPIAEGYYDEVPIIKSQIEWPENSDWHQVHIYFENIDAYIIQVAIAKQGSGRVYLDDFYCGPAWNSSKSGVSR